MIQVVTYATHAQGMFDELVKNKHNIPVKVLGWGTKWTGFSDKFKGVLEYANTLNPDDILIFVDGFDSKIIKDINTIRERFLKLDCGLLVSRDVNAVLLKGYISELFGECKGGITANSGLYMGYVKNIKMVLQDSLNLPCKDDQVALNSVCKKYDFIKVDDKNRIFKNVSKYDMSPDDACIIQRPGEASFNRRIIRGIPEYSQFMIEKILVITLSLAIIFPNHRNKILLSVTLFGIFFVLGCEKSCIKNK